MTGPGGTRPGDDAPTEKFPPTGPGDSDADPPTQQLPPTEQAPPTAHIPPVPGGTPSTAWSEYPDDPTVHIPTGDVPPPPDVPPPGDMPPPGGGGWDDDGWDDNGGGGSTPWMIAAIVLAVALVAGLLIWLVNVTGDDSESTATSTSTAPSTVTRTSSSTRPTSPTATTTRPPSAAERCTPGFVTDRLGEGTTVRECDREFLLVSGEDGETGLYTWRDDSWAFLADPGSDVCREQLEELGVPDRFRRVFQPCEAPSPSPTRSSTASSEAAPPPRDTATTDRITTSTSTDTSTSEDDEEDSDEVRGDRN